MSKKTILRHAEVWHEAAPWNAKEGDPTYSVPPQELVKHRQFNPAITTPEEMHDSLWTQPWDDKDKPYRKDFQNNWSSGGGDEGSSEEDLVGAFESGAKLPPTEISTNGVNALLTDGNHRAEVADMLSHPNLESYIHYDPHQPDDYYKHPVDPNSELGKHIHQLVQNHPYEPVEGGPTTDHVFRRHPETNEWQRGKVDHSPHFIDNEDLLQEYRNTKDPRFKPENFDQGTGTYFDVDFGHGPETLHERQLYARNEVRKKSGILRQREIDAIFREADMAAVIGGAELPDHDYLQHHLGDDEDWGIVRTAAPTKLQPVTPVNNAALTYDKPAPGSSHGAEIHNGPSGDQWLVKKAPPLKPHMVDMDVAANRIATHSGLEAPATFKMNTPDGGTASAQVMYPGAKDAFPHQLDPESLHDDDLLEIQKHHALDWMLSNHDDHKQNFIRTKDNKLVGIDKGQAMKFFNNDRLHWDFFPNAHEPVHNTLYRNMAQGGRKMHDPREGKLGQYIQGLQDIPDEEYQAMLQPYAEGAAAQGELAKDFKASGYQPHHGGVNVMGDPRVKPNDVAGFLDAATQRKNNLMNDFGKLYDKALAHHETGSGIA